MNGVGILAGLVTAILWAVTSVCFESAGRTLGTWSVNVLRMLAALLMFMAWSFVRSSALLPAHLSADMWTNLALSGFVGFVVGDLLLIEAFVRIGARLSMLIYASVPAMTSISGFLLLGESLSWRAMAGIVVTTSGIALAVLGKGGHSAALEARRASHRQEGILLAVGASMGQAAGLLLGKVGSVGVDSFDATEVRVLAGFAGFVLLAIPMRQLRSIGVMLGQAVGKSADEGGRRSGAAVTPEVARLRRALAILLMGAVLGPFLGVSLALKSVQLLPAGVASTLMSIVPVLLVPVSAFVLREAVRPREVLGTVVAIAGVAILAL